MSKTFFFRRNPLARDQGPLEKVETVEFGHDTPRTTRRVLNADGSVVQEWQAFEGGSALDPEDNPTYHGDRLIERGSERDAQGNIIVTYERVDEHGDYKGTIETTWEQTGPFQRTHTKSRRVF